MRTSKLKEAALEFVNEVRRDTGREPLSELPKGYRGASRSCPIANALNSTFDANVGPRSIVLTPPGGPVYRTTPPEAVTQFIKRFDAGRIPELDLMPARGLTGIVNRILGLFGREVKL